MSANPFKEGILTSGEVNAAWREGHSQGYQAGLEAAATFLDAQWKRGGVTQEETEALKRLAAGVRALPIKGRKP